MKSIEMKAFEVGMVLVVHAQSMEEVRQTLDACMPPDLRVESKEVHYCEESPVRFIVN
jgi:hypothetical protein